MIIIISIFLLIILFLLGLISFTIYNMCLILFYERMKIQTNDNKYFVSKFYSYHLGKYLDNRMISLTSEMVKEKFSLTNVLK